MLSANPAWPVGSVVLGATGDGDDWNVLQGHLLAQNWQVELLELSSLESAGGAEALLPPLDGVDAVILVLNRSTGRSDLLSERQLPLLTHLIGRLQGQLGSGRLLVFTEAELAGLLGTTGVNELPYRRGQIETQFTQVRALLDEALLASPKPAASWWSILCDRLGMSTGSLAPELWLILGPLLVLAVLLAAIGSGQLGWPSIGPRSARITLDPTLLGPARLASQARPENPAVDLSGQGSINLLPVSCTIDTHHGSSLPPVIDCGSVGQLKVEGHLGPWHNEISHLFIDAGVVGEVDLEPQPNQSAEGPVSLRPGVDQSLEAYHPDYGVDRVRLVFGADGQQVTLWQAEGRGDNKVILTFWLDR